ncbi:hypothetical protein CK489_27640 [Bradyrhizobium sp. UFLA03-84]|uniref:hypothetical protein n=1 Tax=Bradyrhizobium sp. UFLA03-84 TaxID=418599 RepID=UPI000BAE4D03|nr:hypothetical protein [Bradyrhizobium sp. UFLA03-84]PAY06648.1 hypothetical protein CK489_27640 [Bradyrhizobium sp. UFLA03-84]
MNSEALKSRISTLVDYAIKHVDLIADLQDLSAAFHAASLKINSHINNPVRPTTEPSGLLSALAQVSDQPRENNVVEFPTASPRNDDPESAA